jgi:hypothetical protein
MAQAIQREVGQIGRTLKATRELNGRINGRSDSIELENDRPYGRHIVPGD